VDQVSNRTHFGVKASRLSSNPRVATWLEVELHKPTPDSRGLQECIRARLRSCEKLPKSTWPCHNHQRPWGGLLSPSAEHQGWRGEATHRRGCDRWWRGKVGGSPSRSPHPHVHRLTLPRRPDAPPWSQHRCWVRPAGSQGRRDRQRHHHAPPRSQQQRWHPHWAPAVGNEGSKLGWNFPAPRVLFGPSQAPAPGPGPRPLLPTPARAARVGALVGLGHRSSPSWDRPTPASSSPPNVRRDEACMQPGPELAWSEGRSGA
jgi:hypothetical protein